MKNITKLAFHCLLFIVPFRDAQAQVLDFLNRVTLGLDDGTQVVLYGAARTLDSTFTGEYYYLPAGLRLSAKPDKTPEFLFMKYTSEENVDAGGVQGALMHFLMEWGLTPAQEKEAQQKLAAKLQDLSALNPKYRAVRNPVIMGAANVKTDPENSFQVISAILSDKKFTPTLVTSGRAPVLPGGKVAVAALLEKNAAQLMASTLDKNRSIADASLSLRFKYDLLMPAVEGRITVNWERMDSLSQHYTREANRSHYTEAPSNLWDPLGVFSKEQDRNFVTDTEKDSLFTFMKESKVVDVQLENLQPESQVATEMVHAFMEYFLQSVTEKEFRKPDSDDEPKNAAKEYDYAFDTYKVDKQKLAQKISRRSETYYLKVRLPITQEFTLTGNLAGWYDAAKNNVKCVNTVNLNDPFFEHRDIYLILDMEAEEMFGKELNFVTVDIRKRRNQKEARDFSAQVTFDRNFFAKQGNRAVVGYSKAQSDDPDAFEYKVQWSLRGGNVFPKDTVWTRGRWEGVTLAPPVATIPLHFEADLEDLKAFDIKNVTLQIRYYKFGREVESSFNLNTIAGIGFMDKNIYMDRNTRGYAYRFVFYHKTKGPLATEWEAKLNTNYMFAVIPDEIRNNNKQALDKMIELGKDIISPPDGKEIKAGSILDKFEDLIKTN